MAKITALLFLTFSACTINTPTSDYVMTSYELTLLEDAKQSYAEVTGLDVSQCDPESVGVLYLQDGAYSTLGGFVCDADSEKLGPECNNGKWSRSLGYWSKQAHSIVIWTGARATTSLPSLLGHEAIHWLSECSIGHPDALHKDDSLWGPEGAYKHHRTSFREVPPWDATDILKDLIPE